MNINAPSDRFWNLPFMKNQDRNDPTRLKKELRLPFVGFLPNKLRNHFIAMMGEFAGTFLFLFFAFTATQVANAAAAGANTSQNGLSQAPNASTLLYISLAFGFSLAVNAWVFFRISGGLFNPAVTLALALIGAVGWVRALLVFIAQMLGSMAASGVVSALFPGPLNVSTTLGGDTSIVRGLFIEMFLTTELILTILMLAAEKHKGTFLAPIGIGLSLFIAELAGVFYTGGGLNPARAFGPCVAVRDFPGYHWIYWLGPFLGTLLAVGFYRFVKVLEYETANPGQDFNDKEAEVFEFDEENAATAADVARPNVAAIGNQAFMADQTGALSPGGPPGGTSGSPTSGGMPGLTGTMSNSAQPGGINGNGAGRTSMERPLSGTTAMGPSRSRSDGLASGEKVRPANDAAYRAGPDAENGQQLGGNYRVSGLEDF